MTHFDDGSAYSYLPSQGEEPLAALNVGWLDAVHRFPTGVASPELLEKIAWLCVHAQTCQTRGIHRCELCAPERNAFHYVEFGGNRLLLGFGGKNIRLGSAEIRVRGVNA